MVKLETWCKLEKSWRFLFESMWFAFFCTLMFGIISVNEFILVNIVGLEIFVTLYFFLAKNISNHFITKNVKNNVKSSISYFNDSCKLTQVRVQNTSDEKRYIFTFKEDPNLDVRNYIDEVIDLVGKTRQLVVTYELNIIT